MQVEGLDRRDYRTAFLQVKGQIETAVANRLSSLDKFKLLQQRCRRMSVVAPVSDKDNAIDFEQRIAVCKITNSHSPRSLDGVVLVDTDFRNGLFKLTAMLIHNLADSGED